ncbi:LysR family transcriptional regulator [Wenxinia marina]|uniref:Transcriptional regulator, LysR family n=1 Tax=Wenxinia marina DSM 24838 TaxID=1123501 RepID=A0A0D0P9Z8_9RHOB|nr:LysR family transcriptional regulator [Wenxinia marina]KIQ68336.1 transcriptional regulator, LysR family [Wenxinia marina DSM 24838]GGL72995.1 LysR family transcriptional regulator [Wenxinia marina]
MPRNLDLTALRSFAAVAESGGVTRAAGLLNLTQSAVSMQLKRLEESLGLQLLDRTGRGVSLTASGEQLLGYARRMLALNDEVWGRLTAQDFEGEVVLGVPHDVVYPAIPQVLHRLAAEFPRVKVHLVSSFTRRLLTQFERGEVDVILTTEDRTGEGGILLAQRRLIWVGAPGGQAWRQRPLRLAFEHECIFRQGVQRRLDEAGIPWEMAVDSNSSRTVEATVSADLAVHTMIAGTEPRHFEAIVHGGALPDLREVFINLYARADKMQPVIGALVDLVRQAYDVPALRSAAE